MTISQSGRTALGEALSSRSVTGKPEAERETVKWLIQRGADLDEPSQGRTPLMIAAVAGKVDQVRDLLDRGADPNVQTSEGESVLQLAAEVGAYNDRYVRPKNRKEDRMAPVIEVLLEAGADPAAEDSCAVLSAAAGYRCLDVVKALVAAGAPVDPPATGCEATPLMFATGSVRITRFLLKRGADPRARDPKGNTPLHWAAQQWRPRGKVLRALVRAGADIDSNGEYGDTPLIKASRTDVLENVETLLQLGADPSRVNHRGQTARDAAIERNYPSIVKAFEETALQG